MQRHVELQYETCMKKFEISIPVNFLFHDFRKLSGGSLRK